MGGCLGASCGNGEVESDEACDDGNLVDGDGCSASCTVEPGWTCTDETCVTVCGDGLVRGDETCDDGNLADGDGCSASCTVETGWTCEGQPSACACAPHYLGEGCAACRVHVDADGGAAQPDGLTWASALATVQEGIRAAAAQPTPCEVWVAAGVYLAWTGAQSDTLQLEPGVALYGGFAGTETSREERSWDAHPSLLDGREPGSTWRRVFHVVTGADDALLDGFTIKGGRADGVGLDGNGGGLLASGVSPTVANCRFEDNEARWGGALYLGTGSASEVRDSTFLGNRADFGGAVASVDASALLTGLHLEDNAAAVSGGAVYALRGRLSATGSAFEQNRSAIDGGGLAGVDAYVLVAGCTLTGNTATSGGGLLAFDGAVLSVTSALLEANQARQGAGVFVEQATLELVESEVTRNVSPEPNEARGAGLHAVASEVSLRRSRFSYNLTGAELTHAGGAVYLDACASAEVEGVEFAYNGSGAGGGIWSQDTPLVVAWSRFVGNDAQGGAYPDGGAIDLHGGALDLRHSELLQNHAERQGGAVSIREPTGAVLVATCLVAANSAGEAGDGLALGAATLVTVAQSTLSAPGGSAIAVRDSGLAVVNTLLEGALALDAVSGAQLRRCLVPVGFPYSCADCVSGGPGFVGGGDYHLAAGSPGIGAGDASLNPTYGDGTVDLDGSTWSTPRDVGCFGYLATP
jgi:cysteine-rich repeat protein